MTSFGSGGTTSRRAAKDASEWLALRDAGWDADIQIRFRQWLALDPLNAQAWERLATAWSVLDSPREFGTADTLIVELAVRQRRRRHRRMVGLAGLGAAAAIVGLLRWRPVAPAGSAIARQTSVPRHQVLADGTAVDLKPGADIEVRFSGATREVRLVSGEARFNVVHNAARPFVLRAGDVTVSDLGTDFDVRMSGQSVQILVTEGRVRIQPAADSTRPPRATVDLGAGHLVDVPFADGASQLVPVALRPAEMDARMAWYAPQLVFSGTSLAEAVERFNQSNRLQLSIADPELARQGLSGRFRANNAEGFVRLLEANYGVRADRVGDDRIVLRAAHER